MLVRVALGRVACAGFKFGLCVSYGVLRRHTTLDASMGWALEGDSAEDIWIPVVR